MIHVLVRQRRPFPQSHLPEKINASTLSELGLGRWERLAGILSFNLGIETMQLAVVAATLPSLILMSRTRAYPWLRIGGALFAGVASVGWIAERVLGAQSSVDKVVNELAHQSVWAVPTQRCLLGIPECESGSVEKHLQEKTATQIFPLRYSPVEMTKGRVAV
jgi:hypothetical protein